MPFKDGLSLELARCYDQPEVGLCGCTVGHGLVVFMEVRVVVDFQAGGREFRGDLDCRLAAYTATLSYRKGNARTFSWISFSTGPPASAMVANSRWLENTSGSRVVGRERRDCRSNMDTTRSVCHWKRWWLVM